MPTVLSRKPGGGGSGGAPSGPAGGVLSGTYPNPGFDSGAAGSGEVLTADGAGGAAYVAPAGGGDYTLISDSLLGSAGTFDFTSIPGTYKHLKVVFNVRGSDAGADVSVLVRMNNDSGNNYDWNLQYMATGVGRGDEEGNGVSAIKVATAPAGGGTANRTGSGEFVVPDYAGTTFHKTLSFNGLNARANQVTMQGMGVWANTAAITRLTILPDAGATFVTGSRATLYGLG